MKFSKNMLLYLCLILLGLHTGADLTSFISVWDTTKSGISASDTIRLALVSTGTYDFTVNWGDGSEEDVISYLNAEHTYNESGVYTIAITGTITGWNMYQQDDSKLLEITQWGTLNWGNDQERVFQGNFFFSFLIINIPL